MTRDACVVSLTASVHRMRDGRWRARLDAAGRQVYTEPTLTRAETWARLEALLRDMEADQ